MMYHLFSAMMYHLFSVTMYHLPELVELPSMKMVLLRLSVSLRRETDSHFTRVE